MFKWVNDNLCKLRSNFAFSCNQLLVIDTLYYCDDVNGDDVLFHAWASSRMVRLSKYYSNFKPAHLPDLFIRGEKSFEKWKCFFLFSNAAKNYAIYFVDAARCSASICLKTKVNRSWPLAISTVRIQLYVQSVTGVELKKELWLVGMIFEINTEGAGNGSCTNGTDIFKHENEIEKNITILVLNNHVLNTVTKMTSRDQLINFSRNNKINSRAFVIFLII